MSIQASSNLIRW
uniref:Uncharacterized protein n=1 Tax=Arundo donax TaxID=35708 RepID=A0A0A9BY03_ARUDO